MPLALKHSTIEICIFRCPLLLLFSFEFKPKPLNTSTGLAICTKLCGNTKMPTITLSLPKEFEEAKKNFPKVNWNEVLKAGILERLEELKKFKELKKRGKI